MPLAEHARRDGCDVDAQLAEAARLRAEVPHDVRRPCATDGLDARAQAAEAWRAFMPPTIVETTLDALGTPNELERRISPDVEDVLGRPAQPFAAWAARRADAFR